jgi:hypothetical protein
MNNLLGFQRNALHLLSVLKMQYSLNLMMETVLSSETLVNFYWNKVHNNPEYHGLHSHCHEKLKSLQIINAVFFSHVWYIH